MNQWRTAHVSCTTAESWHAFYFAKGLLAIQSAGPDRWGCSVCLSLGHTHLVMSLMWLLRGVPPIQCFPQVVSL